MQFMVCLIFASNQTRVNPGTWALAPTASQVFLLAGNGWESETFVGSGDDRRVGNACLNLLGITCPVCMPVHLYYFSCDLLTLGSVCVHGVYVLPSCGSSFFASKSRFVAFSCLVVLLLPSASHIFVKLKRGKIPRIAEPQRGIFPALCKLSDLYRGEWDEGDSGWRGRHRTAPSTCLGGAEEGRHSRILVCVGSPAPSSLPPLCPRIYSWGHPPLDNEELSSFSLPGKVRRDDSSASILDVSEISDRLAAHSSVSGALPGTYVKLLALERAEKSDSGAYLLCRRRLFHCHACIEQ